MATKIAIKPATTSTIGGVIVGDNLTVDATGKLSAAAPTAGYTLPAATDTVLGGVKVGSYLIMTDGVLSVNITAIATALAGTGLTTEVPAAD